jgi:hypothetical protein
VQEVKAFKLPRNVGLYITRLTRFTWEYWFYLIYGIAENIYPQSSLQCLSSTKNWFQSIELDT